jgi:uncharacterized protein with NAD-binding domain and iron-sulfur cluster
MQTLLPYLREMPTVHESLQQQQRSFHTDADSLDASFTALDAASFTEYLARTAAALQTHNASIRATAIAAIATDTQTVSATYVQTLALVMMLASLHTLECLHILLLTTCITDACTSHAMLVQEDSKGLPVVTLALQLLQAVPPHLLVPTTAIPGEQSVDRKRLIAVPDALVAVLQQLAQDPDVGDSMQCTVVSYTSYSIFYATYQINAKLERCAQ